MQARTQPLTLVSPRQIRNCVTSVDNKPEENSMFQTNIIIYFQSWAADGLVAIMDAITTLGDDKYQAGILMLILFGVSFRKGMLLVQLFM